MHSPQGQSPETSSGTPQQPQPPQPPPNMKVRATPAHSPQPATTGTQITGTEKIRAFGEDKRHEDNWTRTPNTTGTGAIHVQTFHTKLTADALVYMDQVINEWLDNHPQYEVKFVHTAIGEFTGKTKEPHLICQVWV